MGKGVGKRCTRLPSRILIPTEFLADADRLKVHTKNRRNRGCLGAGVIETIDLINQAVDLLIVESQRLGDRGIDLTRRNFVGKKIIHTLPRWAIDELIDRMLVAPRGG